MAVFQLIMKLLAINEDSQSALFWAIGIQSTSWEAFSYNIQIIFQYTPRSPKLYPCMRLFNS